MQLCSCSSILWHYLSLGLEWKLTFSSPVATAEFSKFADILRQHFHSIIFQDLKELHRNSITSTTLFLVMLSKAHWASHSRMSGSRWVITPSWLSWSLRSFLYTSSVYSGHLSIFFLCYVHTISLSFIGPIYAWKVPSVSLIFSKWSHLSHSIAFVYFFALFTDEGLLISPCYALEFCIQMGVFFLFSFAFSFSSFLSYFLGLFRQPFCLFAFLFWGGWPCSLSPVQCHEPSPFIAHQALCLSDLVP